MKFWGCRRMPPQKKSRRHIGRYVVIPIATTHCNASELCALSKSDCFAQSYCATCNTLFVSGTVVQLVGMVWVISQYLCMDIHFHI